MTVDSKATGKVCVVLPTYNGTKYLANQLDSILGQTYPNIEVWLRDDGSCDSTVEVIRKYASTYDNVRFIEDDLGNLGCPASFYEIIRRAAPCDYYAFADQDDIWESEKVQRAVDALSVLEAGVPGVYYSSFTYVDSNGAVIREAAEQDVETPLCARCSTRRDLASRSLLTGGRARSSYSMSRRVPRCMTDGCLGVARLLAA